MLYIDKIDEMDPVIADYVRKHWNGCAERTDAPPSASAFDNTYKHTNLYPFSLPFSFPFPIEETRRDFPILSERVNGRLLVYLDNAASTFRPSSVINRLVEYETREHSNIHRGAHELAGRATDAYEDARRTVAEFIGSPSEDNIVFVRGATEAVNLAAHSFVRPFLNEGDEILVTQAEHHANIVPWQLLAGEKRARLVVAPVGEDGGIDLDRYESCFTARTKVAAFTHVSNVFGSILPVREMARIARGKGAWTLIDGAQSAGHMPLNVGELGADCYVFSGHKACGPTGIGALYATDETLARSVPYQGGGHMVRSVTFEASVFQPPPRSLEAGTGNISGSAGLAEALRYLSRLNMVNIYEYERRLMRRLYEGLREIAGVRVLCGDIERVCALSFTHERHAPSYIGKYMNSHGIALRAGHHCAQPALRRFNLSESVRPSLSFYNTEDEVDFFLDTLRRIH